MSGNVVASQNLTVSGNVVASQNLTVSGNTFYTSPMSVSVDSNVVTEYTGPHDRPLRKYPEVILPRTAVGADYNGYRIDRSSEHVTGAYDGVQDLFNETAVDYADTWGAGWDGSSGAYSTSTGEHSTYVSSGTTQGTGARLASNVPNGEWVSLKSPNAIKLDNIKIRSRNSGDWYVQFPTDFQIWGSNDGTTWSHVKTFTGQAAAGQSILHTFSVNSTTFYNRHALVVTKIPGTASTIVVSTGQAHFSISELRFNAKEEGSGSLDTTLKTVYNVPATTGTQLEVYYDGQDHSSGSTITDKVANANATISSGSDITFDSTWKAWTFSSSMTRTQSLRSGTLPTSLTSSSSISAALWFKFGTTMGDRAIFHIANPQASRTANQLLEIRGNVNQDYRFQIWDGQYTWQFNPPFFNNNSYDIPTGEWYHLAMSITDSSVTGRKLYFNGVECDLIDGSRLTVATASELNLPSDAVLELGRRPGEGVGNTVHDAGNEFDGSIANFRLYSKALNAGQVKELYDYQKDYFLGSKSQVTLYKGHLGVGVTEPSGQLELAGDERIQEYPPGPMGRYDYETLIPGHGVFCAYASVDSSPSYSPGGVFDKTANIFYWDPLSTGGRYSSTSPGNYILNNRLAPETALGEYLVLKLPYKIKLEYFTIRRQSGGWWVPQEIIYYAKSEEEDLWEQIHSHGSILGSYSVPGQASTDGIDDPIHREVKSTKFYRYFALVITKSNALAVSLREWQLFGTPGPTTLDKGSLTLGRSLDVPRISRYDVDTETPRPEKLVVDFDTTVNSSPTDISGKGNHGTLVGATYSAADKAFDFSVTNNVYITRPLRLPDTD